MSTDPVLTQHKVVVLLVDDQPMIGEAVRRMLAGEPDIDFHYNREAGKALDEADRVMPTVILIVGVHFIPLARAFHARRHYATGAALIVVAFGYPWITNSGSSYPSGAFATGSILWISALYGFLRNRSSGITARLVERNRLT